ncbi:MAG: penicillin acylase family protein [Sphingobacterium sp.]|nr:penicillin acylase family protein [Sphingobacterium sp.]
MHLELALPAVWYEVQLSAPGMNVRGVSFPAAPLVVAGYNREYRLGLHQRHGRRPRLVRCPVQGRCARRISLCRRMAQGGRARGEDQGPGRRDGRRPGRHHPPRPDRALAGRAGVRRDGRPGRGGPALARPRPVERVHDALRPRQGPRLRRIRGGHGDLDLPGPELRLRRPRGDDRPLAQRAVPAALEGPGPLRHGRRRPRQRVAGLAAARAHPPRQGPGAGLRQLGEPGGGRRVLSLLPRLGFRVIRARGPDQRDLARSARRHAGGHGPDAGRRSWTSGPGPSCRGCSGSSGLRPRSDAERRCLEELRSWSFEARAALSRADRLARSLERARAPDLGRRDDGGDGPDAPSGEPGAGRPRRSDDPGAEWFDDRTTPGRETFDDVAVAAFRSSRRPTWRSAWGRSAEAWRWGAAKGTQIRHLARDPGLRAEDRGGRRLPGHRRHRRRLGAVLAHGRRDGARGQGLGQLPGRAVGQSRLERSTWTASTTGPRDARTSWCS